ncbi:MAG TPA: 1,4-dihydroxy-2-naphthoate octaprenyltransferase, partial [Prolixibacteraceae bacterium]|nr:1,4-dihydroxy-2-naphthoate octaprenyltransferase [Prolixibacteraceae bacterium]
PYGYIGLGDLFVFIFFGMIAVAGTYFLHTRTLGISTFLPVVTLGFLSSGVLNVNNMRDIRSDRTAGKKTVAVMLGLARAKAYHIFLVAGGWAALLIWTQLNYRSAWQWIYLVSLPLFVVHLNQVMRASDAGLDPQLKRLAIGTFVLILLFGLGIIMSC